MIANRLITTTFAAPDINCGGCAASIQKALGRQAGVQTAAVDVPAKTVTIQFDPNQTDHEQLAKTLTEIGFPPNRLVPDNTIDE